LISNAFQSGDSDGEFAGDASLINFARNSAPHTMFGAQRFWQGSALSRAVHRASASDQIAGPRA